MIECVTSVELKQSTLDLYSGGQLRLEADGSPCYPLSARSLT
jgi:hypothetical protein